MYRYGEKYIIRLATEGGMFFPRSERKNHNSQKTN